MSLKYVEFDCLYCQAVEAHLKLHGRLPPDSRFRLVFNTQSRRFGGYIVVAGIYGPIYHLIEEFVVRGEGCETTAPPCVMYAAGQMLPTLGFWAHALRPRWQHAKEIQKRRRDRIVDAAIRAEQGRDELRETVRIARRVRGSDDPHARMMEAGALPYLPRAQAPEEVDRIASTLKEAARARDSILSVPGTRLPSRAQRRKRNW